MPDQETHLLLLNFGKEFRYREICYGQVDLLGWEEVTKLPSGIIDGADIPHVKSYSLLFFY